MRFYNEHVCKLMEKSRGEFSTRKELIDVKINRDLFPNEFITFSVTETKPQRRYFIQDYTKGLKKVIGYDDKKFSIELLLDIINKNQKPIAVEFAFIAYSLLQNEVIGINNQTAYWVECNIKPQNSKEIRVRRCCWLLSLENMNNGGKRLKQIDLWSRLNYNDTTYVDYGFEDNNIEVVKKAHQLFYKEWMKRLGLANVFSPIHIKTLDLVKQGLTAKNIAENLNKKANNCNIYWYKNEIKSQLDQLIKKSKWDKQVESDLNINEELRELISQQKIERPYITVLNFIEQFNLLPKVEGYI